MQVSPEVTIAVAVIALIGSLIASLVVFVNASERKRIDRELIELKAFLDTRIATVLQATKERHELRLNELEHKQAIELAEVDRRIQAQLTEERMREVLNEANWRRVVEQIRTVKNFAHDLIALMKGVCSNGHETPDEQILNELLGITKLHRDFREAMKPLFGEIRPEDYDRLESFFKYQGQIILDIDRNKSQRIARRIQMVEHTKRLEAEERMLEALSGHFLRPTFRPQGSVG